MRPLRTWRRGRVRGDADRSTGVRTCTSAPSWSATCAARCAGRAIAVDPEPAAVGECGAAQGAVADDAGAQQRRGGIVVEGVRERVRVALVDDGQLREAPVGVPAREARLEAEILRAAAAEPAHPTGVAQPGDPDVCADREPRRAGPTRSTIPTISWPGTASGRCTGRSPSARCRSVRHTPHTETRTRISPGPGVGSARSPKTSGPSAIGDGRRTHHAFMSARDRSHR